MRVAAVIYPRASLLSSLGCIPVNPNDAGIEKIVYPVTHSYSPGCTFPDTLMPVVKLKNYGDEPLTSVTINYQLDNGVLQNYFWIGELSKGSWEYVDLPPIAPTAGNHTFLAYTCSPNGFTEGFAPNDSSNVAFKYHPTASFVITKNVNNISCYNANDGSITLSPSQGVEIIEDWEGEMSWTLVNGVQPNQWMVGTATANGEAQSIYISNDGNSNSYSINSSSIVHFYKDFYFPSEASNITIKFDWKGAGESGSDYLECNLIPTSAIPAAGYRVGDGQYKLFLQNSFATEIVSGSEFDAFAGSTGRLVFSWVNNNNTGNQPPAAIDNISVSYEIPSSATYNYLWDTNPVQTTATLTDLEPGTYTVTITDDAGCSLVSSSTITQPDALVLTTTQTDVACHNGNDGTATVMASGGAPDSTFLFLEDWEGQNTWTFVNGSQANKWHIGTETSNGGEKSVYISNNYGSINYSTTSSSIVHFYKDFVFPPEAKDIQIHFDWLGYGQNGYDYFKVYLVPSYITPVAGSQLSSGQIGGPYNLEYFFSTTLISGLDTHAGTSKRLVFTWTNNGSVGYQPPAAIDNIIVSYYTPGTGTYNYSWNTQPEQTTSTAYNLAAGTYTVTVTDENSCTSAVSVTISEPAQDSLFASITAEGSTILCSGESVTLISSPASAYLWSSGETTQSITVSTAGNYSVTVTDEKGCTAVSEALPVEASFFSLTTDLVNLSCFEANDGAISVNPVQKVEVTEDWEGNTDWILVNGQQPNKWIVGTATANGGSKSIYISNNGSSNIYSTNSSSIVHFYKDFYFPPEASNITVKFDFKGAGESGYDYLECNLISLLTPVAGWLVVNGPHEWSLQDSFVTVEVSGPEFDAFAGSAGRLLFTWANNNNMGMQPPAAIDNITVSYELPTTATYSYLWDTEPIQTTATIPNLPSGTYTVTVTDDIGCSLVSSYTVTQPEAIVLTTSQTEVTCHGGNDGTATVVASGGVPDSTFSFVEDWEGANTWTLVNGSQTNKWHIGTATKVSGSKAIYISNNANSNQYSTTSASVVHFYKDFSFPANATNIIILFNWKGYGESGYDYLKVYLIPTNITPVAGTQLSSGQIGPVYYLQSTFTTAAIFGLDANAGSTMRLVFSWKNDSSFGYQPPAAIDDIVITFYTPDEGTYTYSWNTQPVQTSETATNLSAGSYIVSVTDATGCTQTASVNITEPNPVTATITPNGPTTICAGESVTLTANQAVAYLWSNGATTQNIAVSTPGNYSVTVTDENGCLGYSSVVNIAVNPLPVALISPNGPTSFCEGESIVLTASGGDSYLWSNGSTSQGIIVASSGDFLVVATNLCGSDTSSVTVVTVNPSPEPIITPDGPTTFCEGNSVSLTSSVSNTYLWSNGATTQTTTVNNSGSYSVTVTDANDCSGSSEELNITVNPLPEVSIQGIENGDTLLLNQGPVTLIGNPLGGTFFGNGITGNIFDPAETCPGECTITYTYTDENNCTNSNSITIFIDDGVSTTDLDLLPPTFSIYPNPTTGLLNITAGNLPNGDYQLALVNVLGQTCREKWIKVNGNSFEVQLDLTACATGVYFLSINSINQNVSLFMVNKNNTLIISKE
ncbi:MAG: T9SS type A sorting domain-containing protein [Saprospiraceae bacterium]